MAISVGLSTFTTHINSFNINFIAGKVDERGFYIQKKTFLLLESETVRPEHIEALKMIGKSSMQCLFEELQYLLSYIFLQNLLEFYLSNAQRTTLSFRFQAYVSSSL